MSAFHFTRSMAEAAERVAKLSPEERADLLVEYFDWPADRRAEVVERARAKDRQRVVDTEARIEPPAKKAAVAVLKYADVVKLVQKAEIEAMVIALRTTNTNPYLHHLANTSEQQAYKAAVRLGLLSEHGPGWSRITDKGWAMLRSA